MYTSANFTEKNCTRTTAASQAKPAGLAVAAAWLVFRLGEQQFGVDASAVRECVRYSMLGSVADGATIIKSVVVWRGKILPLVDLRAAYDGKLPTPQTDIVIFTLVDRLIAVAVDGALEVIMLAPWQINPMRDSSCASVDGGLIGSSTYRACALLLLDIEALMSGAPRLPREKVHSAYAT